jgi:hypothetical protein
VHYPTTLFYSLLDYSYSFLLSTRKYFRAHLLLSLFELCLPQTNLTNLLSSLSPSPSLPLFLSLLSRYAWETEKLKNEEESAYNDGSSASASAANSAAEHSLQQVPVFVYSFFVKKYGLKAIVDQNCWDFTVTLHHHRATNVEAAMMARFLEDLYVSFFLLLLLWRANHY